MTLVANNVSLTLSGARLLDAVSLSLEAGQVATILGPNGAGKTSLLRTLTADVPPGQGEVTLNNRTIDQWSPEQRARTLAVLPQHSLLDFPFSGLEVVLLGRTPHDTGVHRDHEIAMEALALVDAEYLADRPYTRLSGGEKQRVQLARVLAQVWEPVPEGDRFLVLDEPTASFDLAHQQLTLEIVARLAAQGIGVLMVIHDLNLAARCADQMVLMQCGRVVGSGVPAEVLTTDNIRTVFNVDAVMSSHPVSGTPLVIT